MKRAGALYFSLGLATFLALFVLPAAAQAASQTFTSDGTFTVPAGVYSISTQLWGAGGAGGGFYSGVDGGAGGYISGTANVTPGSTLYVYIDHNGGVGGSGSPGGGCAAISFSPSLTSSFIVAAGGGGGPGYEGAGPSGAGGGYSGGDGSAGGTQSSGGANGGAGSGSFFQGGTGAPDGGWGGGGGGGCGYYGGAGGARYSASGGGSSWANGSVVSGVTTILGGGEPGGSYDGSVAAGNGHVTLSWTPPSPVNGSCGATHYSCASGSDIASSNSSNATNYTWTCSGAYGGSNSPTCSENKVPPPASMTASCSADASSVTLSWSQVTGSGTVVYYPRINGSTFTSSATCPSNMPNYVSNTCYVNGYNSTSITVPVTPGVQYNAWVHAGNPDPETNSSGWLETVVSPSPFSCAAPKPDLIVTSETLPSVVSVGTPVSLSGVVKNQGTGSTGSGFSDLFEVSTTQSPALFSSLTATVPYTSSAVASGASNTASGSYTFSSIGTYYVRLCANTDASNASSTAFTESNWNNNCYTNSTNAGWVPITVVSASLSGEGCILPSGTNTTCNVKAWWQVSGMPASDSLGLQISGPGISLLQRGPIIAHTPEYDWLNLANLASTALRTGLSTTVSKSSPYTQAVGAGSFAFQLMDINGSTDTPIGNALTLWACPAGEEVQTDANGNEIGCATVPNGSSCNPGGSACVGNTLTYYDISCNVQQQFSCYQCSTQGGAHCVAPPTPSGPNGAAAKLTANPSLVRKSATSTISWDINYVGSCTSITGDPSGPWGSTVIGLTCTSNGDGTYHCKGSHDSSPLVEQTTFSMSCTDFNGNTASVAPAIVNIIPAYQEK